MSIYRQLSSAKLSRGGGEKHIFPPQRDISHSKRKFHQSECFIVTADDDTPYLLSGGGGEKRIFPPQHDISHSGRKFQQSECFVVTAYDDTPYLYTHNSVRSHIKNTN